MQVVNDDCCAFGVSNGSFERQNHERQENDQADREQAPSAFFHKISLGNLANLGQIKILAILPTLMHGKGPRREQSHGEISGHNPGGSQSTAEDQRGSDPGLR